MQVVSCCLMWNHTGRGSWLDFEFDPKDILHFKLIEKKTSLNYHFIALGFSKDKIIETFYSTNKFTFNATK